LHAFETIESAKTALVVIDLDLATVSRDEGCERMVAAVNALAEAATFYRIFGDVRPTSEVIELLRA
jgi:hypothetical protein